MDAEVSRVRPVSTRLKETEARFAGYITRAHHLFAAAGVMEQVARDVALQLSRAGVRPIPNQALAASLQVRKTYVLRAASHETTLIDNSTRRPRLPPKRELSTQT
jgi:hypothetical protein